MIRRITLPLILCFLLAFSACNGTAVLTTAVGVAAIGYQTFLTASGHFTPAQLASFNQAISTFQASLLNVNATCGGKTKLALTQCLSATLIPAFQSLVSSSAAGIKNPQLQAEVNGALAGIQLAINLIYTTQGQPAPAPVVTTALNSRPTVGQCDTTDIERCVWQRGSPAQEAFVETVRLTEIEAGRERLSGELIVMYGDAAREALR